VTGSGGVETVGRERVGAAEAGQYLDPTLARLALPVWTNARCPAAAHPRRG
jgi:hypothetical protein